VHLDIWASAVQNTLLLLRMCVYIHISTCNGAKNIICKIGYSTVEVSCPLLSHCLRSVCMSVHYWGNNMRYNQALIMTFEAQGKKGDWGTLHTSICEFGDLAIQDNIYRRRFLFVDNIQYWKHAIIILQATQKISMYTRTEFSISGWNVTGPISFRRLKAIVPRSPP
jgi:hypothetical protein